MAFLIMKLNIVAILLILLSFYGARSSSAFSLHQSEKQHYKWSPDCRIGYRKLGLINCENAGGSTNMKRDAWSQSLKTALSPPPAPVKKITSRFGNAAPPPPHI